MEETTNNRDILGTGVGEVLPTKIELSTLLETETVSSIAKQFKTYPNKIRRLAKNYSLVVPDHSKAQSRLLASGGKHPTKGKTRSQAEKVKISEGVFSSWSDERKDKQREVAEEMWKNMTKEEQEVRLSKAYKAIREASKHGSKLEKFLLKGLIKANYKPSFHVEHKLANQKLEIDILIPSLKLAIEIDGPSHFEPIWGEENLKRNKKSDKQKSGLLLGAGFKLIRVKHAGETSQKFYRDILAKLIDAVQSVQNKTNNEKLILI